MLAHKKSISLLLCAAMLLSMFATVPVVHASQAVAPLSPTNDVYSVGPDVYTVDDDVYIVDDDVAVYDVRNDIPDGAYLCDAEGIPYCDAEGNPISFASLHEAVHAAQAIMIAVHDKRNDGTLPGEGADEVYYIVKGDGTYYSAGDPAEPVAYTSGVEAVSTAMRFGYPAVERVGEAETAAFYAASSLGILSMVTAGDLASAIAEVQNSDYSTIVLNGSVSYDHGLDCDCEAGQVEITKDLDIIAYPGSAARVYWNGGVADRTLWVDDGVTLTLGSDALDAGALVFDGGANWSGSYAWFGDVLNRNYVGREHTTPLITLEHSAQSPVGNTLIVRESVIIQNYINATFHDEFFDSFSGNGVISVITFDSAWTVDSAPEESVAQVHLYGKMINNASKQGGAIYLQGGDLYVYDGALLSGNSADFGGAVCFGSDAENKGMPTSIFMYGGEMSHNSAYDGGAVALWVASLSDVNLEKPTIDPNSPPATFTMYGGSLNHNTAHSWVLFGLEAALYPLILGECGGGAVAMITPNAAFNMLGGEITWNRTLPLSMDNDGQTMNFREDGHAIAAGGALPGNQLVSISGGTIANNGVDSYTGEVTGTAIEVRQDQSVYKLLVLNEISGLLDDPAMSGFESSSELYQELLKLQGNDTADMLEVMGTLCLVPMDDIYALLYEVKEYIANSAEFSDEEKAEFEEAYATYAELKEAGICESGLGLIISDDPNTEGPTLQEGQSIGLGADTYIRLEDDVTPPPEIVVNPYANPGTPVVEYGGTNESPEFTLSGDSSLLLHDEESNLWYIHDPNAVYTVTYKVGSKTYVETVRSMKDDQPVIPSVTLPTVAEAFENGWITEDQAQYNFSWYYNDNGVLIKYSPDGSGNMPRIILSKDMTFVGAVDANASITIHYNNEADEFEIWHDLPLFSELDPTEVATLYATLNEAPPVDPDPPADPENPEVPKPRKIIAAGLTTERVTAIVDKSTWEHIEETYGFEGYPYDVLYHTVWALVDGDPVVVPAMVNPYIVDETADLYVLWAYDENENDIPDFLEVTLTADPNGGTFNGSEEAVSLVTAMGTTIPHSLVEAMLQGFAHSNISTDPETGVPLSPEVPVLPVGAMCVKTGTPDVPVVGKIYDIRDRETLAALQNVFYLGYATDYVVTEDETFYAIWSYDAPSGNSLDIPANPSGSDGVADVLEVIITIDPNGGKLYIGMQDGNPVYVTGQMPMWVPKGATIPAKAAEGMSLAGLQQILVHDNGPVTYTGNTFDSPVVLVGLTEVLPTADTFFTPGKIFSALDEDKAAFAQLTDLINVWNPADGFVATEDATYYAVWSYDITMVEMPGIVPAPDIYEALLTLYPNGGALIVGEENGQPVYSTDPMSVLIPINGIILPEYLLGISQMFAYPSGSCVLAGITADEDVLVQNIYGIENREEFFQLTGVIRADGNNDSYKVTGNTNLYAVWSKDIDGLGDPDVFEMAITLDANGGTIMGTPATTFMYPIPQPEPESEGTQITYEVMMSMSKSILTAPTGLVLYGLAFDSAGTQPITDSFFMAEDTTIYAIWSDRATVRIHHNDGTGDVTSWELTPQVIAPAEVEGLFGGITPPVDHEGRPVIPAGLTTRQIEGIVGEDYELPEGVELYHSVWAVGADMISAAVNPYTVTGTDDLYVLWAYDENENGIPDFLEVELELEINAKHGSNESKGTLYLGEKDNNDMPIDYHYYVYIVVARGTEIPGAFFEQVMLGLSHSGLDVTDPETGEPVHVAVCPVGITTDETVDGRLPYSAAEVSSLESLENLLYKGKVSDDYSYTVTGPDVFYTVWGYDENGDGRADIAEFIELTLNPNGGMVDGRGVALTLDYRVNDEAPIGDIMTRFSHTDTSLVLVGVTTTSPAEGLLGVYGVENRAAFTALSGFIPVDSVDPYTVTGNVDFYVVWSKDEDGNSVADVYQLAITLDANGGTITGTGAAAYVYPIPAPDPETDGTQITYDVMIAMSNALLVAPDGMTLLGLAFDPEGTEMITETFFVTEDTTVYAIWLEEGGETPPEYSVTIEWGDLTFTYSQGAWNTETHTYGEPTITPSDPDNPEENWISVCNNSTEHITVSVAYEKAVGFEGLAGFFALDSADSHREEFVAEDVAPEGTCRIWVWLDGTPGDLPAGTYTCGTCIVTITAIESTEQHFYLGEIGATGVDSDGDGYIDYYTIDAIADLPQDVVIPGSINGIPVEEITKLYSGDGTDGKLNQTVQSIHLGEGIKIIREHALSATPNLSEVYLPSTLTTIEGNAFALNPGQEKDKVVAMIYNGTKEQWDAVEKASDWAKALDVGTTVTCTDGVYSLESANGNNSQWGWTPNN